MTNCAEINDLTLSQIVNIVFYWLIWSLITGTCLDWWNSLKVGNLCWKKVGLFCGFIYSIWSIYLLTGVCYLYNICKISGYLKIFIKVKAFLHFLQQFWMSQNHCGLEFDLFVSVHSITSVFKSVSRNTLSLKHGWHSHKTRYFACKNEFSSAVKRLNHIVMLNIKTQISAVYHCRD